MGIKNQSDYIIEQFTLQKDDLEEFANILTETFLSDQAALEEGSVFTTTKESFDFFFNTPITDPNLFVRAIHKPTNKVVGFLGNFPRTVSMKGKEYKFVNPGWLSVLPSHRRKGIATLMGRKFLELIKEEGYDGGFALFEPEQHGKDIARIVTKENELNQRTIFSTTKFVVRVFDDKKIAEVVKMKWYERLAFLLLKGTKSVKNPKIRLSEEKDTDQMYNLILEHIERNDIAVVHDKEYFKQLVNHRLFLCVVHEDEQGKIDGLIGSWEFLLSGFGKIHPFGWLDLVHTHKLSMKDATNLCRFLSFSAKERGWVGIQTPYFPYFDAKPFQRAKFIFYGKRLFLDIAILKEIELPDKIEKIFFDWR
ncbi:MAG: GNAT family N-acetyltransferase [Candidatus Heimdallarchaeota archaeon]|nr:GNAT family N-acetyltransferase [Candidatus Heimdallarchaeota archaeon]MCK4955268.1 GNAT family N-acetyltransferase [Candidatus Heimdallarchaeota archaeon]